MFFYWNNEKEFEQTGPDSEDQEEDITPDEDVIKSMKVALEGVEKRIPSKEEFFSTDSRQEPLARNFNELRLSRPLLRAINVVVFL